MTDAVNRTQPTWRLNAGAALALSAIGHRLVDAQQPVAGKKRR